MKDEGDTGEEKKKKNITQIQEQFRHTSTHQPSGGFVFVFVTAGWCTRRRTGL